MTPFSAGLRARATVAAVCAALLGFTSDPSAQTESVAVQWTSLQNAVASGSSLVKSGGCDGCADGGALSVQALTADGYVQFAPAAGGRLYAGLGSSAGTDPAAIDFAFSFWPDGTWDIRERGTYRAEGHFVNGDTFRITVSGGVIQYFHNGNPVHTSTTTPTMPLAADTTLVSTGATLTSATISTAAGSEAPPDALPPVPSTYDAISDRVVREKGTVPPLGPAGYTFTDPAFGSRMVRLTDANTRPGAPDRSYRTPSGTHSNAWSLDMRHFYTISTDGTVIPYAFDAGTMRATRLQPTGSGDGGATLRFFNEPTFSYITPGVIYGTASVSGSNLRSVDQYDMSTGQYTQLLNLDSLVPNLAGTYAGGVLASAGPPERIVVFFGGPSQDRHMYLVVFDKANPSNRKLVDTYASTVNGQVTNVPLNFTIHALAIDRSGRYVMIYPTGADLAAPRNAEPVFVWDVETNIFTPLPAGPARTGGHDAYGYGTRVNQDCCTSSTWDAAQWQFRSLATPLVTADLIAPVLLPKEIYLADHPSWHNARPDRLIPFINASYRYGANTTAWRAWDEEIIAVKTDQPGTGGTVWRFGHHRSKVANDLDSTRIGFWYTPRVNVSPDGRFALFTSNWEKTLGVDPRGETGSAYRQDMFLVELRRAVADSTQPLTVTTTQVPDAVQSRSYTTVLEASGGSGNVSWTISAGSLPAGLSLNGTNGVISGTPTQAGSFAFTVRAVDAADSTKFDDAPLTMQVAAATVSPLVINTSTLPDATRDVAYSTTVAASGGLAPLTWAVTAGALPSGLSLNTRTGVISGVSRLTGTVSFTLRVSDSSTTPKTVTKSFSIRTRKQLVHCTVVSPSSVGVECAHK